MRTSALRRSTLSWLRSCALYTLGLFLVPAIVASTAVAIEEDNLWRRNLPPTPPFDPNARLVLAEIAPNSAQSELPETIQVEFRRFDFDLVPSSLELWIDGVEYTESLQFWVDRAWVQTPRALKNSQGDHTIIAKIWDTAGGVHEAITDFTIVPPPCQGCPWPFAPTDEPSVVSNLMEDFQSFSGTYWHGGLDIRVPAGTPVHSITDGTVVKIINYNSGVRYWEIAVQDPQGYIWQYHHVDPNTFNVAENDVVNQGDILADVVPWTTSMNGWLYHHLHLNVVRWLGGGAIPGPYVDGFQYHNPLRFLTQGTYNDAVSPSTLNVFFSDNESNNAFAAQFKAGPVISGDVDIHAWSRDEMTNIGTVPGQPYRMGLYEVEYSIHAINTTCGIGDVPKTLLARFDKIPGGTIVANQEDILHDIFQTPLIHNAIDQGSEFNYNKQQLVYTLTNVHNGFPNGPQGFWNTDSVPTILGAAHPDGDYLLRVYTTDYYGNETIHDVDMEVDNGLDWLGICPNLVDRWIWQDPMDLIWPGGPPDPAPLVPPAFALEFGPVVDGTAIAMVDSRTWPAWNFVFPTGMQISLGLLDGNEAKVEYVPYLGDVILEIPAEAQVVPIGAAFDSSAPSANPVMLRISTRLARHPVSGAAFVGKPAEFQDPNLAMVVAAEIPNPAFKMGYSKQEMLLLESKPNGSKAQLGWDATGVSPPTPVRHQSAALKAFPNPFNPQVSFELRLESATRVVIEVLDVRGRRVRQVFADQLPADTHTMSWDGKDALGRELPSGVYFVHAWGDGLDVSTKVALLR